MSAVTGCKVKKVSLEFKKGTSQVPCMHVCKSHMHEKMGEGYTTQKCHHLKPKPRRYGQ